MLSLLIVTYLYLSIFFIEKIVKKYLFQEITKIFEKNLKLDSFKYFIKNINIKFANATYNFYTPVCTRILFL